MEKKAFKEFLASYGDEGVKTVALQYATESDDVTIDILSDLHNITKYGIRKLFEYAIVNCVVSFNTACLMKDKAHRNQTKHSKKANASTKYYLKLFAKRFSTVKAFSDEKVTKTVQAYISSPDACAIEIASSMGLSIKELNIVLKKAIIFNIVDDNTAFLLRDIAINKAKNYYLTFETLKNYFEMRKNFKDMSEHAAQLIFQLETFDDFASDEDVCIKESIENELTKVQQSLENFRLAFFT